MQNNSYLKIKQTIRYMDELQNTTNKYDFILKDINNTISQGIEKNMITTKKMNHIIGDVTLKKASMLVFEK